MQNTQQIAAAVSGRVEILRDRSGVPHVYAASTPDLYFGLGIAMAQDRLWQMDRLRRRALGRQAEILGPAYVASDIAHLTVGIDEIADREVGALDERTHQVVSALVAGDQSSDRSLRARPAARVQQARLCTGAVRRARCGGDRPRHLVVAEWPHRPHRGGRSSTYAARGVPRSVPDAGSLGEPCVAVRRGHR